VHARYLQKTGLVSNNCLVSHKTEARAFISPLRRSSPRNKRAGETGAGVQVQLHVLPCHCPSRCHFLCANSLSCFLGSSRDSGPRPVGSMQRAEHGSGVWRLVVTCSVLPLLGADWCPCWSSQVHPNDPTELVQVAPRRPAKQLSGLGQTLNTPPAASFLE